MPHQNDLEDLDKKLLSNNKGLILVASLIDKSTNVGGICRTCEIFNVKELVISYFKIWQSLQKNG